MPGGTRPQVLFCTTENDVAHIARAMHAGVDDYIMKPFDREIMRGKVEDIGLLQSRSGAGRRWIGFRPAAQPARPGRGRPDPLDREHRFPIVHVGFDHHGAEVLDRGFGLPVQHVESLAAVADQQVHLGWPVEPRVDPDDLPPGRRNRWPAPAGPPPSTAKPAALNAMEAKSRTVSLRPVAST